MKRSILFVMLVVAHATGVTAEELDLLPLGDPTRAYRLAGVGSGDFYDCRRGEQLDLDSLADRLAEARVVLVGEAHTDMAHKRFHAELLEALAARVETVVLGMEFFLREHDGALEKYVAGHLDEDGLLAASEWYDRGSYRFGYYRPLMEAARSRGLRVVGLNIPRDVVRTISRHGIANLDDSQRQIVGDVPVDDDGQHRYLIGRYFGDSVALMPPSWFDNMYAAQCTWDVAMARSILDALPETGLVMVVVGSGHVAYDLGISRRVAEELRAAGRPQLPVATFVPVTAPPPATGDGLSGHPMGGHGMAHSAEPARFVRSLADFVGAFPDAGGVEAYPQLGLRLEEAEDGGAKVMMAWPDTPAAAAGFAPGDRVVDLNGTPVASLAELRLMLAGIEWGQRIGLQVDRDGEQIELAMLLYPEIETNETAVAPGYEVATVGAIDPTSAEPVKAARAALSGRRRLVSRDDAALRVEVLLGDSLEEVHELDEESRVVRSVFRTPREDGAVEVRYQRDRGHAVVEITRFDRTGSKL